MPLVKHACAVGRLPSSAAVAATQTDRHLEVAVSEMDLRDDDSREATAWMMEREQLRRRLLGMIVRNEALRKANSK